MKRIVFGVFAHPDDEAFGPSAYFYKAAISGQDVHLILITDGDAGAGGSADLGRVRLAEWRESAHRIGAVSASALHYGDGTLSNKLFHEIGSKVNGVIAKKLATYSEPISIDLVTFDPNGITGHLDHIATTCISNFVFDQLKSNPPKDVSIGKLKYYCLPLEMAPHCSCKWVHAPCGRRADEIDEVLDFSDIEEQKLHIMRAHVSKKKDMEEILHIYKKLKAAGSDSCYHEYFMYHK